VLILLIVMLTLGNAPTRLVHVGTETVIRNTYLFFWDSHCFRV